MNIVYLFILLSFLVNIVYCENGIFIDLFVGEYQRCDILNLMNLDRSYFKTEGKYPPKDLGGYPGVDSYPSEPTPFNREQTVRFNEKIMISTSSNNNVIIVIYLEKADFLYTPFSEIYYYRRVHNSLLWYWNEKEVNDYLDVIDTSTGTIVSVTQPCHPNTDGLTILWSDLYKLTDENHKIYRIYYREPVDRFVLMMPIPSQTSKADYFSDLHAQVCGDTIYFQRLDYYDNTSTIAYYHKPSKFTGYLHKIVNEKPHFGIYVSCNSDRNDGTIIWLVFDEYGNAESSSLTPTVMKSLFIHYVTIKDSDHRILFPSDWDYKDYNLLYDVVAGEGYLFIHLCNNDFSEGYLRIYSIEYSEWKDLLHFTGCKKMNLVSTSHNQLVYEYNETYFATNILKKNIGPYSFNENDAEDNSDEYNVVICQLFSYNESKSIIGVDITNDIALYKVNDNNQRTHYYLYDLNKDNDLLWDVNDRFPLNGFEYWDEDGDGIGDNGDIVDGVNDYALLYGLFCVYIVILLLIGFLIFKKYYSWFVEEKKEVLKPYIEDAIQIDNIIERQIHIDSQQCVLMNHKYLRYFYITYQMMMIILSILSCIFGIWPFLFSRYDEQRTLIQINWVDTYITGYFIVDLIFRFIFTADNYKQFLYHNLFMIISVYPELPGFFIGNTNFAQMNPLLRIRGILRFLLVFRALRFYQLFISLDYVTDIMVRTPGTFLTLFMFILLVTAGITFKILEQDEQNKFENLISTIWFSLVTITTVGYGDMAPLTWGARIIAIVAMVIGIGLIGTVSANISNRILNIGDTDTKVLQVKADNKERFNVYAQLLQNVSHLLNPILNILSQLLKKNSSNNDDSTASSVSRSSSLSNSTSRGGSRRGNVNLELDSDTPPPSVVIIDLLGRYVEQISPISHWQRQTPLQKRRDLQKNDLINAIYNILLYTTNKRIDNTAVLRILLRSFHLEKSMGLDKITKFEKELSDVIFGFPRQNDLYIEKIMSLKKTIRRSEKSHAYQFDLSSFHLQDPLDAKLTNIEKILQEYKIYNRVEFKQIQNELQLLTIQYERVLVIKWILFNLDLKDKANILSLNDDTTLGKNEKKRRKLTPHQLFKFDRFHADFVTANNEKDHFPSSSDVNSSRNHRDSNKTIDNKAADNGNGAASSIPAEVLPINVKNLKETDKFLTKNGSNKTLDSCSTPKNLVFNSMTMELPGQVISEEDEIKIVVNNRTSNLKAFGTPIPEPKIEEEEEEEEKEKEKKNEVSQSKNTSSDVKEETKKEDEKKKEEEKEKDDNKEKVEEKKETDKEEKKETDKAEEKKEEKEENKEDEIVIDDIIKEAEKCIEEGDEKIDEKPSQTTDTVKKTTTTKSESKSPNKEVKTETKTAKPTPKQPPAKATTTATPKSPPQNTKTNTAKPTTTTKSTTKPVTSPKEVKKCETTMKLADKSKEISKNMSIDTAIREFDDIMKESQTPIEKIKIDPETKTNASKQSGGVKNKEITKEEVELPGCVSPTDKEDDI